MGSVPLFQNPYGRNGNSPSQIDQVIGTAYEIVREVGENLEYIKHVSAHMEQVFRLAGSTDAIDAIYTYIEELAILLAHIEEVLLVAASLEEILDIHEELAKLLVLSDNITQLADLYDNLDEILSKGGTVIVSETPPTGQPQGRLWWETDSGNLFAWYDDGTSAQWVQINIASTSYSWTDILDKPSTFPPTNHTHAENVKKTGDTMTGWLSVCPPTGAAGILLKSTVNASNLIYGQVTNAQGVVGTRWVISLGNTLAESGVSTGADFVLTRFSNASTVMDTPLIVSRSTGVAYFWNGSVTKTQPDASNDEHVATTRFVKNQINSFHQIAHNVLTVYGVPVIHVPAVPGVVGTSLAYGNGLTFTQHKAGSDEGMYNQAVGTNALLNLTTGRYNTAVGIMAGQLITTGHQNTAIGRASMLYLKTGYQNTGVGQGAMVGDPAAAGSWYNNTGIGVNALYDIKDTAVNNTGVGVSVLANPGVTAGLAGQNNSAFGTVALRNTTTGNNNCAFGYLALGSIQTGHNNIAIGFNAGTGIVSGSGNVIIGFNLGALAPTLSNSIQISVGNGTRVLTGDINGAFLLGTQSNTTPLYGYVGEYREINLPAGSARAMVNGVPVNVCQLAIPPGDWDVYGWIGYISGAATTYRHMYSSLSLGSATLDYYTPGASTADLVSNILTGASPNNFKGMSGYRRMSISASDTVYLVAYSVFTGNAPAVWGRIWARRMR